MRQDIDAADAFLNDISRQTVKKMKMPLARIPGAYVADYDRFSRNDNISQLSRTSS
jgi:hypothetical protein